MSKYKHMNLFYAMSVFMSLSISLLLVWSRGLYIDDYVYRMEAQDIFTATWKPVLKAPFPYVRELGQIVISNTAAAIPQYEFFVRFIWLCVHGGSVILLCLLIYRVTHSWIPSGVAGWMYAAPFFAHEAVLWHVQSVHQIGNLFFLLSLYLFILIIDEKRRVFLRLIMALLAIMLGLQFSEMSAPAIIFPPFAAVLIALRKQEMGKWREWFVYSIFLVFIALCVSFFHYLLFTGRSSTIAGRGGLTLYPLEIFANYKEFVATLYWFTFDPTWGKLLIDTLWIQGISVILQHWAHIAMLMFMIGCGVAWIRQITASDNAKQHSFWLAIGVTLFGIFWMIVALLPGTLLQGQILEWRMLYFFLAGFAVMAAGFTWCLILLCSNLPIWFRRLILLPALLFLIWSTILLLGYADVYRLRYNLDQRQVQILRPIIESPLFPNEAVLIAITPNTRLVTQESEPLSVLDQVLFGAFEVSYAGQGAVQMAYRRNDVYLVSTHHWRPGMLFDVRHNDATDVIVADGVEIPLNKAIIFTFRTDKIVLARELVLMSSDGKVQQTIPVPTTALFENLGLEDDAISVLASQ